MTIYGPAADKTDLRTSPIIPCDVIFSIFKYSEFSCEIVLIYDDKWAIYYYRDLQIQMQTITLKWRPLVTSHVLIGDVIRSVFSAAGSYMYALSLTCRTRQLESTPGTRPPWWTLTLLSMLDLTYFFIWVYRELSKYSSYFDEHITYNKVCWV
jgi:hypothetical protein